MNLKKFMACNMNFTESSHSNQSFMYFKVDTYLIFASSNSLKHATVMQIQVNNSE